MKIIALIFGITLSVSAQNNPFVHRSEFKTNIANIPAQGIVAAHVVTQVIEIAHVATITGNGVTPFEQPAVRVVSNTTNLASQIQKPLLSAQPKAAVAPKPASENVNTPAYKRAHRLPPFDK